MYLTLRKAKALISSKEVKGDGKDTDYIFMRFVVDYLPAGLIGLLIVIIFLASWGSIAVAINSLASSTMVDFHRRFTRGKDSGEDEYRLSKNIHCYGVYFVLLLQCSQSIWGIALLKR